MSKFIMSVLSASFVISLVGCGSQNLPLAGRAVQTFAAPKTAAGPVRSNATLDAVAKRARFVIFQGSDRNRDGQISPQEMSIPGLNFSTYDKNKDGQLNFTEFDTAMMKISVYGMNRDSLRQQAQMMWQQINKDNNQVLVRSELEEFFTAPYNNPPMPMPPMPMPTATSDISNTPASPANPSDPYSGGYGNGYGDPHNGGYAPPNYEQLKYEARKQAIDFFVQTDANLDQQLSFSEYEDGFAKQMLSSQENNLSNNYSYYYPSPGYGSGYGSSYPAYPVATALPRR